MFPAVKVFIEEDWMKRILALVVAIAICLAGCSSGDYVAKRDYDKLVKRVEALEEKAGIVDSSVNVAGGDEATTSVAEVKEKPELGGEYGYMIDDLSVDEIYDLIVYYLNNEPYDGQSYDEYRATLKKEPFSNDNLAMAYGYNPLDFGFCSKYAMPFENGDHINRIYIYGDGTKMDGTIEVIETEFPHCEYGIELTIEDYDRAVELYDKLAQYCNSVGAENIRDSRESTTWRISGTYKVDKGVWSEVNLLTMRREKTFVINVKILK